MKYLLASIFVLFITKTVWSQDFTEFKSILDDCGMTVEIPSGFVESEIIENDDMGYEYAIRYPDKEFELRYAVRPITYKNYANDEVKNELEGQRPFRNSSSRIILQTVILNITGGIDYSLKQFDYSAVNAEFNADWGATTFVELNSDFGAGFKYCMIVAIHKKDIADAYYFYLANTKKGFMENVNPLFHTLRFD